MENKNPYHVFRSVSRSGIQKIRRIEAPSFELAREKAILKFSHIINHKQTMDLVTAIDRAKKASVETKKPFYVIYEDDMECSVNTAPLKGAAHKFVLGQEDKTFHPKNEKKKEMEEVVKAPKAAPGKVNEKPKENKVKTQNKKVMAKAEKKSPAKKVIPAKKVVAKKSAPAKKAAKKATTKKVVKAHEAQPHWGKKVNISIKDMLAGMKKGFRYRDPQGKFQAEAYLKSRANQEYVREGMYVSKAE